MGPPAPMFSPQPPRRRRPVLWTVVGVVAAIAVGAAVWGAIALTRPEAKPAGKPAAAPTTSRTAPRSSAADSGSDSTKVVTATDKKSQVTVPASWSDAPPEDATEDASIQVQDRTGMQALMVITEPKDDFVDFDAYVDAAVANTQQMTDAEVGPERTLTVGGLPAVQYVVTGTSEGVKLVYWLTIVQGEHNYHQVVAFTSPSQRAKAEPVILDAVNSFKELAG